jgi:nitroimidazol reductase NimA-like FMN-containing flavoprotein (pyridoxamine 5'-phosphate oxidase superfamily)
MCIAITPFFGRDLAASPAWLFHRRGSARRRMMHNTQIVDGRELNMMNQEERRQFVRDQSFCVWGYNRREHGPAMTPGYYTTEGDDICFYSMRARAKARVAKRDPRASVCILDQGRPPSYLQVFGQVRIEDEREFVYDIFLKIIKTEMEREGNTFSQKEADEKRAESIEQIEIEDRVVLRLTPESTFFSPPTQGATFEEKFEFRSSLGEVKAGSIRIGAAMPW